MENDLTPADGTLFSASKPPSSFSEPVYKVISPPRWSLCRLHTGMCLDGCPSDLGDMMLGPFSWHRAMLYTGPVQRCPSPPQAAPHIPDAPASLPHGPHMLRSSLVLCSLPPSAADGAGNSGETDEMLPSIVLSTISCR